MTFTSAGPGQLAWTLQLHRIQTTLLPQSIHKIAEADSWRSRIRVEPKRRFVHGAKMDRMSRRVVLNSQPHVVPISPSVGDRRGEKERSRRAAEIVLWERPVRVPKRAARVMAQES